MQFERDVSLAPRTTLGLGGTARRLVQVADVGELVSALASADAAGEPVLILGGGSNLVVRDEGFPGLVIQLAMTQVNVQRHDGFAIVNASAGVVWDDFVREMVDSGLVGVECLSGIPGRVGATPMQNVGAYGQEVSDTIVFVRGYDRETKEIVTFDPEACRFGYRSSVFRGRDRWVVIDVRFRLARGTSSAPIRYAELAKALGIAEGGTAPLAAVRDTVIQLRRGKGMVIDPDDPESRSAGSFFTNPIVDPATIAAFEARLGGATYPSWPAGDGRTKLAAAWLIERAGFAKGTTRGGVGISHKHALALVNRGGTATELLALAAEIQDRVRDTFGIELHPEPIIV